MGWGDAIAQVGRGFNAVFHWLTGGQSRKERSLDAQATDWEQKAKDALARGDVGALNHAREQLARVRDEAAARYLGH